MKVRIKSMREAKSLKESYEFVIYPDWEDWDGDKACYIQDKGTDRRVAIHSSSGGWWSVSVEKPFGDDYRGVFSDDRDSRYSKSFNNYNDAKEYAKEVAGNLRFTESKFTSKSLKEWFSEKDFRAMSPEEQEQYLKDHPDSKFQPTQDKNTKDDKSTSNDTSNDSKDNKNKEVQKKEPEKSDIDNEILNKLKKDEEGLTAYSPKSCDILTKFAYGYKFTDKDELSQEEKEKLEKSKNLSSFYNTLSNFKNDENVAKAVKLINKNPKDNSYVSNLLDILRDKGVDEEDLIGINKVYMRTNSSGNYFFRYDTPSEIARDKNAYYKRIDPYTETVLDILYKRGKAPKYVDYNPMAGVHDRYFRWSDSTSKRPM